MDDFRRHLDKEFLDAIECAIAEACEEMQRALRGNGTRADWHLRTKAAWDMAIDNAVGRVLDRILEDGTLEWDGSVSEPIAHSPNQKLNRFER